MTTGITPPRACASQISMILPPFGYFQTLAEPAKALGKTKYNHNSNAYLPFDERVGRLSDLQPQLRSQSFLSSTVECFTSSVVACCKAESPASILRSMERLCSSWGVSNSPLFMCLSFTLSFEALQTESLAWPSEIEKAKACGKEKCQCPKANEGYSQQPFENGAARLPVATIKLLKIPLAQSRSVPHFPARGRLVCAGCSFFHCFSP